jgi:corrinoid protein of di/trimethylamine methyltransferase
MALLEDISLALQKGQAKEVKELVQQAIDSGVPVRDILDQGLMAGMDIIGGKFKRNEVFVPEVLIAARAMNAGTALLKPLFASAGVAVRGRAVIGTVRGDLHDIGKNLVRMMIEGKGIEVTDLGVDVPAERFVEAAVERKADLVCLSALLTTTMGQMKTVVDRFAEAGIRGRFKIMVGGAPITDAFRASIGADSYAPDAASAADAALGLLAPAGG